MGYLNTIKKEDLSMILRFLEIKGILTATQVGIAKCSYGQESISELHQAVMGIVLPIITDYAELSCAASGDKIKASDLEQHFNEGCSKCSLVASMA